MGVIYLDQNYISNIAGFTRVVDADAERTLAMEAAEGKMHRFAVSVWNMYETARAPRRETREGCIEFIAELDPLYCANPRLVQTQEIVHYLAAHYPDSPYRNEAIGPFCDTPARMWATFGSPQNPATPFVGETFRDGVRMLTRGRARRHLDVALDDSPAAAAAGRDAYKAGIVGRDTQLIDRTWLMTLLPERHQASNKWIPKQQREAMADLLLAQIDDVYRTCPTVHAEEQTFRYRVASDRKLRRSDGVDVQFFTLAVAHCDFLVTSDGALREMFASVTGRIGSKCRLLSRLQEL